MDKSELILKTTKELKEIAESGANKIALAMQEATKANYINFVSMLYHYSVPGEAQLNKAALASPTAEMQRLFSTMAEEEADHDIVAMKDMKSMGYKIGIEDELVSSYHRQWDNFTEGLCCVIKFKDRTTPFRVFLNQYDKFQAYLTQ